MQTFKTSGKPSGTLKIKSTSKNINLLIEMAEQSERPSAEIKEAVRAYVRVARMLDVPVVYTTYLTPEELWVPEKPTKKDRNRIESDPPADKPHPPKPE